MKTVTCNAQLDIATCLAHEVGELPLSLQSKLLNALEAKLVTPVGAVRARPIDVRFIAATNRSLGEEVNRGTFRADLYYRLAGLSLTLPPLRERRGEIAAMAADLIEDTCRRQGRAPAPRLSPDALGKLERHSWPGNIRELRNVVERATLLCPGPSIEAGHLWFDHLPPPVSRSMTRSTQLSGAEAGEAERERIIAALEMCGGNQTRAARVLGIARSTLTLRLGSLGLPRPRK